MKFSIPLLFLFLVASCSIFQKPFVKEKVCSPNAVSYYHKSTGRAKNPPLSFLLQRDLESKQADIQLCYEDFKRRTGKGEFQTCMVVGIDHRGEMEYYNFSSQEINSDRRFIQCASKATRKVSYKKYGKNYILVQSYRFY